MEPPKYSVVMPLYNKEQYVERAIASVFNQQCTDGEAVLQYELIVVDDGSSDRSASVAAKCIDGHSNCKLVQQRNSGVGAARNRGVAESTGEYVCFLDADDWWEPSFLQQINRLIHACPNAGIYCTGYYLVKNGKQSIAPIGVEKDFESGYIDYCRTYCRTLCMPVTSSSSAVRRGCFDAVGGFDEKLSFGEDFHLWIRLALKYPVALVNRPLANYFQDLPPMKRATRRLHNPERHMLWNLGSMEAAERENKEVKRLFDLLRSGGLYRYYLSRQYHDATLPELAKIDWSTLSAKAKKKYTIPLWVARTRFTLDEWGAACKRHILAALSRGSK